MTTESIQGRKVFTGSSLITWKVWTVCTAKCNGRMAFFAVVLQNLNFNPSISFILTQDYSWIAKTLIFQTDKSEQHSKYTTKKLLYTDVRVRWTEFFRGLHVAHYLLTIILYWIRSQSLHSVGQAVDSKSLWIRIWLS